MIRHADEAPEGLPLRFIGFAKLVWGYLKLGGISEQAAMMLTALRHTQSVAVGERDPLVDAILAFGEDILAGNEWYGTPAEMVRALTEAGAELPFYGGGKKIARLLREAKDTLDLMGWMLDWGKSGHTTRFKLRRAPGQQRLVSDGERVSFEDLSADDLDEGEGLLGF